MQTDLVRNRRDVQSDGEESEASGTPLQSGTTRRKEPVKENPGDLTLTTESASTTVQLTTKAGKPRERMCWTPQMNLFIMRQYYLLTNNESDLTGYRQKLHTAFCQHYPHLEVTEQRIADQRRAILTKNFIPQTDLNKLKAEVVQALEGRDENPQSEAEEIQSEIDDSLLRPEANKKTDNSGHKKTNTSHEAEMIEKLANEIKQALTEFAYMDPTLRPRIPKQKASKALAISAALMDREILPKYLSECREFIQFHTLVYSAAVAVVRQNGGKVEQLTAQSQKPIVKKSWEQRLENSIGKLRADIGRIYQYNSGNRSKKIQKKVNKIYQRVTKHAERNPENKTLVEILDTLKQQLDVKSSRLRRYQISDKRKVQNKLFNSSQKSYYRNLHKSHEPQNEGVLQIEDAERFWSNIWSNPAQHNNQAQWINDVKEWGKENLRMSPIDITSKSVLEAIEKLQNWKAPGPDQIHNFWLKRFRSIHSYLALYFTQFLQRPQSTPAFLTQGVTYLLPKGQRSQDPAMYRPITCLCTMYKTLTSCISTAVYQYLQEGNILADEQKGCVKNAQGCKEQIVIDSVIIEQAVNRQRNIYTAFIDYKKAFDSVPHSWLLHVLKLYKVDKAIITLLQHLMASWKTTLQLNQDKLNVRSIPIHIKRGIFQGDSLSPLWFCLALNPLSALLNSTQYGFQIKHQLSAKFTISHLLYMDDIKLYAATEKQLKCLLGITETFSTDIGMSFGLNKCRTLSVSRGKIIVNGFEEVQGGRIEPMTEDDTYTYLGHIQSRRILHKQIKEKVAFEYFKRLKEILKSNLNGKNTFKAINGYAIPVLTYTFGTVKWTDTDIDNLQRKTRVTLSKYRAHHPKAATERITLPRHRGGRGLIDIYVLHKKQIQRLQNYFLGKKLPLYEALCLADNNYTPLDLLHAEKTMVPIEPHHYGSKMQAWKNKALHGRHPNELNQDYVDLEASNKWLTQADLFLETEGFMIAIQDQVIATANHRKYILKEANVNDACRRCNEAPETIQHITGGCRVLAPTNYLQRHDNVAKIVHQKIAIKHDLLVGTLPYYTYDPVNVLENASFKLYWNRSILTDKTVLANRPDITLVNKLSKTTYLIDIAIPNSHNLQSMWNEKLTKYKPLADEIKNIWKQDEVYIVPLVLSSTALIPRKLHHSLQRLQLHPLTYIQLQKSVILDTTAIVRSHLNIQQ